MRCQRSVSRNSRQIPFQLIRKKHPESPGFLVLVELEGGPSWWSASIVGLLISLMRGRVVVLSCHLVVQFGEEYLICLDEKSVICVSVRWIEGCEVIWIFRCIWPKLFVYPHENCNLAPKKWKKMRAPARINWRCYWMENPWATLNAYSEREWDLRAELWGPS